MDFNLQRASPTSSRKKRAQKAQKAHKNLAGRKRGEIVAVPARPTGELDALYGDDGPGRGALIHAPAMDRDDEGSDASRFSADAGARGRGVRKRERKNRSRRRAAEKREGEEEKREENRRKEKKREEKRQLTKDTLAEMQRRQDPAPECIDMVERKEKKREEKRQLTKDTLAEMQRQRDPAPECIDMVDEDPDGAAAPRSFDGVRTDKIQGRAQERYVSRVVQKQKLGDAQQEKKQNFRGARHGHSAMAARGSSPRERRQKTCSRRTGRVLTCHEEDPLDLAVSQQAASHPRSQQESQRPASTSASHSRNDKPEKTSASHSRNDKPEKGHVSERQRGGRRQSMPKSTAEFFTRNERSLRIGQGSLTARRRKQAAEPHREELAGAALLRKTANERPEPPSSGEKRKGERGAEREHEQRASHKPRSGPKGSRHDTIDVDMSRTALDESVRSVDASPPREGGADDDAVMAALEESKRPVNQADYAHLNPPASRREEENATSASNGLTPGTEKNPGGTGRRGRQKGTKVRVSILAHVSSTKNPDALVSSPVSKVGLQERERQSSCTGYLELIPRKAAAERRRTRDGRTSHARKNGTEAKLKKQGGVFADNRGGKPAAFGHAEPRRTRSSSRARNSAKSETGGSHRDVIMIDSSSDEDTGSSASEEPAEKSVAEGRPRRKRPLGDRTSIDAVRIAVGKKVFHKQCELSFQFGTVEPYIQFSYFDKEKQMEHPVYLKDNELQDLKYFVAGDEEAEEYAADDTVESMTVIAFRITPTDKNKFKKYSNAYSQEDAGDEDRSDRRYISVEVRDADEFKTLLYLMREHESLAVWCNEASAIPVYDLAKYTMALQEENRKERERRRSVGRRTRSGGNAKKKEGDNTLLLVYPFEADKAALTEAASELKELGGDPLGVETPHDAGQLPGGAATQDQADGEDATNGKEHSSSRTHYVTIRQDDKERLCPGQFLNDSLVDFWMRWISRGEPQVQKSDVHFFTSHFMTTLKNEGPTAVSSWTAKKHINVFQKRLVFVPVNADLHWSLCVIVNPGLIANNHDGDIASSEEHSFILFLDSLKMHNRGNYAKHIRKWLNCEWKRLGKGRVGGKADPFDKDMLLRSPKIPYQENGCDCGVFVCRYAYSLFLMRNDKFTWDGGCERFLTLITKGPAFQFDMRDIARIREEMGMLIDNLSIRYLKTKEQEKVKKRAKRKEIESSKRNRKDASSEMASEGATSGKEDGNSARTACDASGENSGALEGSLTEAAVVAGMDKNGGDAPSSEEKENISQSQDNIVREIFAPDAPASFVQESDSSDTVLSGEAANSTSEKDKISMMASNEDDGTSRGSITGIAVGKANSIVFVVPPGLQPPVPRRVLGAAPDSLANGADGLPGNFPPNAGNVRKECAAELVADTAQLVAVADHTINAMHMGSYEEKENSSQSMQEGDVPASEEKEHVSQLQESSLQESDSSDTVLSGEAANSTSGNEGVCSNTITMPSDKDGGTSLGLDEAKNRDMDMTISEEKENISQPGAPPSTMQGVPTEIISPTL